MTYNALVEDCFFNPRHVGILDLGKNTLRYHSGQLRQSASLVLYLQYDDLDKIVATRFKAYGNPYFIAGVEWLCRHLEGQPVIEMDAVSITDIMNELEIPKTAYALAVRLKEACHQLFLQWRRERGKNA